MQSAEDAALGLPATPLAPTIYYVEMDTLDGTVVCSFAKRLVLQVEPAVPAKGEPMDIASLMPSSSLRISVANAESKMRVCCSV